MGLFSRRKNQEPSSADIRQLTEGLEQADHPTRLLLDSIADGVVLVNGQQNIRFFNRAAASITGWPVEEAAKLNYRTVFNLQDESGEKLVEAVDPFLGVLRTKQTAESQNLFLLNKEGKKVAISLAVSPLNNNKGEIEAVVGVFRDISKQYDELQQRAEFISTASHEMRTPVAAIEGYLALAMNEQVARIDSKARAYLEKAHVSTQHLGKLFQDLLTAAKSEDGRLSNHPRVTDVGDLVTKLVEDLRFGAEKKGLRVALDFGDGEQTTDATQRQAVRPLLYAQVDPERIREVVTNLFDNAVKYTEEGKITVSIRSTPDSITAGISDTGPGIPAEDLPHLFQKFYRVDNSATREVGGTGLGLFICRKIIELYQGRIWAESEVGKGTTFFFTLPRLSAERAEALRHQEEATQTPLSDVVQGA